MIVVADTSPLRYLIVIGCDSLWPALYGRVLVPPAVADELNQLQTPEIVRSWMVKRPDWLEIQPPLGTLAGELDLDRGELDAIALAVEVAADLLLVDDWDARQEATRRNLRVVGTLRVLADAARLGLTDLEDSFERLRRTNFRASPDLLESLLEEYREAKDQ